MSSSGVIFMKLSSTSQCIQYGTYCHADSQEFLETVDGVGAADFYISFICHQVSDQTPHQRHFFHPYVSPAVILFIFFAHVHFWMWFQQLASRPVSFQCCLLEVLRAMNSTYDCIC